MDSVSLKHIEILDNGSFRPAANVAAVERIMAASKKMSFWDCLDEIMKVWQERNPSRWEEIIYEVKLTKSDLKDKKFATTPSKNMERRLLLRMPDFVNYAITILYPDFKMDRKFFNTFARRYPAFRVSDKV